MLHRIALILLSFSLAALGQTTTKTAPKKTPTPAATAPAGNPKAVIHTTAGDLTCELFPDKAPKAVENFIGLSTGKKPWTDPNTQKKVNKPLYDGVIFHRVIPNFMIQSGDPMGTGMGNPGFEFEDELNPDLLFDRPGRLAMANHGPNTNGSQFFITEVATPFLNPQPGRGYTLFGQCDDASVELVKKIAQGPCQAGPQCSNANSKPLNPVKITHIAISGAGPTKPSPKPAVKKPAAGTKASPTPQQK
jgi:peptidyl-prolyl cis-trans isomerase A (cyclophilin A)